MRFAFAAPLLLSAGFLVGCGSSPTASDDAATPRVSTTVTVEPREFVVGQPARVRVAVTNDARLPATFDFASSCQIAFEVRDSMGVRVGPDGILCTTFPTQLRLAPHETRTTEWEWSGERALGQLTTLLPLGNYSVIGGLVGGGEALRVPSDSIHVELKPPVR